MSLADASGAFVIECGGLAARSVTGPRLYVEALTPLLSGSPPDARASWSDCRPPQTIACRQRTSGRPPFWSTVPAIASPAAVSVFQPGQDMPSTCAGSDEDFGQLGD